MSKCRVIHKAAGEDVFYEMEEALIKSDSRLTVTEAEQSVIGSAIVSRDAIRGSF